MIAKSTIFIASLRSRFSDESLTKKASLNALATALDYIARVVVGFLIQPLMVFHLGEFGYGAWQVLDRSIGYISPATGRPTQALKVIIANRQDSKDNLEKQRYVGSAIVVWIFSLPILLIAGGLLAWYIPSWLDTPSELVVIMRIAAAILLLDLILTSLTSLPKSILEGENMGYKRMGLATFLILLGGAFTWLVLILGWGLIGLASAVTIVTTVTGLIFWQITRMQVPWFGAARPSFAMVRSFFGLSWWFLLWNFVMRATRTGDVVLLGIVGTASLVTDYSFTRYVPETMVNFLTLIVFGIAPGIGGLIGSKDFKAATRVRNEIMSLTWLLTTVIGTGVLLWNEPFVTLWASHDYYAGNGVNLLIMIMVLQFAIIRNDANIIDFTLEMRDKVLLGLLSTVISIGLGVLLIRYFDGGIAGLCIGSIVGRSILMVQYPRIVGRSLAQPMAAQIQGSIRPTVITLALFGSAFYLAQNTAQAGWIELISGGAITVLVATTICYFGGISTAMRGQLWKRLRSAIR